MCRPPCAGREALKPGTPEVGWGVSLHTLALPRWALIGPAPKSQQKDNSPREPPPRGTGQAGASLPSRTRSPCAGLWSRSCSTLPGPGGVVGSLDPGVGGGLELSGRAALGMGSPGGLQRARVGLSSKLWVFGWAAQGSLWWSLRNRTDILRFPDLSHLTHTIPLWGVNGRDDFSHFTDEQIEVGGGGNFARGHPGSKDLRGSSWLPASMGSGVRR